MYPKKLDDKGGDQTTSKRKRIDERKKFKKMKQK